MSRLLATRIHLQRAALADLHPGWLAGVDASLLRRARDRGAGRRWLSRRLAKDWTLFRELAAGAEETSAIGARPWLLQPLRDAGELLLDLGTMALTPLLRAVVARDEVLRLHRVLGEARYREALVRNYAADAKAPPAPLAIEDDADLLAHLQAQGAAEMLRHAQAQLPTVVAERVRLAFAPDGAGPGGARLIADDVAARLARAPRPAPVAPGAAA